MLDGFRNFQNSKRFCGTDTHSCPHMSPRHSRHTLNAIGIDWPMQSFTSGEEVFPSRPGSRTPRVSCRSALKKVPRRCRHGKSHQDISGSNSLWLLMTAYDIIKYDQMLWDDTSLIFTHLHSSSLIFTHIKHSTSGSQAVRCHFGSLNIFNIVLSSVWNPPSFQGIGGGVVRATLPACFAGRFWLRQLHQ